MPSKNSSENSEYSDGKKDEKRFGKDTVISVTGHTSLDYLLTVDRIVEINRSSPITDCRTYPGGGAANVAAVIAGLGGRARLVSPVGDDFISSGYEKQLLDLGVDLSAMYRIPEEQLSKAFILTDTENNQSTYFFWGAAGKLAELDPPETPFVHMATADCVFNAKMAQCAGFVSFDPGQDLVTYTTDALRTILQNTDILFANRHEIELVQKISGYSFSDLLEMIPIIVVTKDIEGSILYKDGKTIETPCIKVKTEDPTGAGDAYKAGFLVAYTRGCPLDVCCRVGAVTASFIVEKTGCQTNLPTWEMMKKRYLENFPEFE